MYIVVSNCLNESHVNKLYSFINSFIDPAQFSDMSADTHTHIN